MLEVLITVAFGRPERVGLALILFFAFAFFMVIYTIFVLHRKVDLKDESIDESLVKLTEEELDSAEEQPEEAVEEPEPEQPAEESEPEQPAEQPAEEPEPEQPAEEPEPEQPAEEPEPEQPAEEPEPEQPAEEPELEQPAEEPELEQPAEEPEPEEPVAKEEPKKKVVIESALEKNNMTELVKESVTVEEAQEIITDEVVEEIIEVEHQSSKLKGAKKEKFIVNIDSISGKFENGDEVNLETLKEKGLLPKKCNYFKVLARGTLDKKLKVVANEYSKDAIKMIAVTGGEIVVLE